jgi:hypothetical protein
MASPDLASKYCSLSMSTSKITCVRGQGDAHIDPSISEEELRHVEEDSFGWRCFEGGSSRIAQQLVL